MVIDQVLAKFGTKFNLFCRQATVSTVGAATSWFFGIGALVAIGSETARKIINDSTKDNRDRMRKNARDAELAAVEKTKQLHGEKFNLCNKQLEHRNGQQSLQIITNLINSFSVLYKEVNASFVKSSQQHEKLQLKINLIDEKCQFLKYHAEDMKEDDEIENDEFEWEDVEKFQTVIVEIRNSGILELESY